MSNSSKWQNRFPISRSPSLEKWLQDSILREMREGHELVMAAKETSVILRLQVMSSFSKFFSLDTTKERSVSVIPEHLLRLNSLKETQEIPMYFSPSAMNLQPSNFRVCNLGSIWKHFPKDGVTCQKEECKTNWRRPSYAQMMLLQLETYITAVR